MRAMLTTSGPSKGARPGPHAGLARLYWTLGNVLLFGGIYLLLYVGGVYAYVDFLRLAARGDSDIEMPRVLMRDPSLTASGAEVVARPAPPPPTRQSSADTASGQAALTQPEANAVPGQAAVPPTQATDLLQATPELPAPEAPAAAAGQIASSPPEPARAAHVSTVQRLVLPSIKVDSKVIEVGWETVEQNGQQVAVWQVAEFAVGQHKGSANPGEGGNIVLAGHVGGYGQVFRDLYYVLPGDPVIVYSQGREHRYTVTERLIVLEEGAPPEQRAQNAQFIAPTDSEVVTMVTCWPGTGPDKFTKRVIIRAEPVGEAAGS